MLGHDVLVLFRRPPSVAEPPPWRKATWVAVVGDGRFWRNLEKVGEGWRVSEQDGEHWRTLENAGGGWRSLEKVGEDFAVLTSLTAG